MMREVFYAYTVQGKTYDNLNIMSWNCILSHVDFTPFFDAL